MTLLLAGCGVQMPWTPAASMDGASISMADYQARLKLLRYLHDKQVLGDTGRPAPSPNTTAGHADELKLEDEAVAALVDETLISQEATRRHLGVSEAEVQAQVDSARKLFATQADFDKALNDYGYTADQLRAQLRARITEVKVENSLAADRAAKVVAALKGGATFASVVKTYSDLKSTSPDGELDLNPNAQTSIDAKVKPAIDALTPGQTTAAVQGVNGYYVARLVSRTADELRVDVVYVFAPDALHYRTQDRPAWFVSFLSGLEKSAHVHYNVGSRAG